MAVIIVDYENVNESGLKGIDSLCSTDKLVIFYSAACNTITQENIDFIRSTDCEFESVKLMNARSNALDMYQATYVGRLIEQGVKEIALVSKDKGFHSIKDYVSMIAPDVQVVVAPEVQVALSQFGSEDDIERRRMLQRKMSKVSIETECRCISIERENRRKWEQLLRSGGFEENLDNVYDFLEYTREKGKKTIYTSALHTFGREQGIKLYGLIRDVI